MRLVINHKRSLTWRERNLLNRKLIRGGVQGRICLRYTLDYFCRITPGRAVVKAQSLDCLDATACLSLFLAGELLLGANGVTRQ